MCAVFLYSCGRGGRKKGWRHDNASVCEWEEEEEEEPKSEESSSCIFIQPLITKYY